MGCRGQAHIARGSEKTSLWMCSIRSPPAEYSITKHTCSGVWKQPNRFTRKGCPALVTAAKIRFSHIRLDGVGTGVREHSSSLPPTLTLPRVFKHWMFVEGLYGCATLGKLLYFSELWQTCLLNRHLESICHPSNSPPTSLWGAGRGGLIEAPHFPGQGFIQE